MKLLKNQPIDNGSDEESDPLGNDCDGIKCKPDPEICGQPPVLGSAQYVAEFFYTIKESDDELTDQAKGTVQCVDDGPIPTPEGQPVTNNDYDQDGSGC